MLDIRKEYEALSKRLTRYKTKSLGFEYGCLCSKITKIELIKIKDDRYWKGYSEAIRIMGITTSNEEQELMVITEDSIKGRDYKYNWKYHIFERYYPYNTWYDIYNEEY